MIHFNVHFSNCIFIFAMYNKLLNWLPINIHEIYSTNLYMKIVDKEKKRPRKFNQICTIDSRTHNELDL